MPQRIRRLILAAYFLVISVTLTGCTVPIIGVEITFPDWVPIIGGGSRREITLEYWGLWEPQGVMQPVLEKYKNDIRDYVSVAYQMRDPRQHFETVRARLTTDNPPDVVRVHATWVPFLTEYLEPMPSEVMTVADFQQRFYPVHSEDLIINGRIYGMPLGIDTIALIYNADHLAAEGYTEPVRNWDNFLEFARPFIKKNNRGELIQGAVSLGYAENSNHFSDVLGLMFAQSGVQFMDKDGKVTFHTTTSPDGRNLGVEALRYFVKFSTDIQSYNPGWEGGSTQAFIEGKVSMIFAPSYRLIDIYNANPLFTVGVSKVPQLTGQGEVNWATYWVEVVPKNGQHTLEAWRLLEGMTRESMLSEFYRQAANVRGFGELYPRPDMASALSSDPRLSVFVEQAATAVSWYFADATYDNLLNDKIIEGLSGAVNAARRGDPGGGLNGAAAAASKTITELRT